MSNREKFLQKVLALAKANRDILIEQLHQEFATERNEFRIGELAEQLTEINNDIFYLKREIKKEQCK